MSLIAIAILLLGWMGLYLGSGSLLTFLLALLVLNVALPLSTSATRA
ncbi:hypothetical protein UMZ34_00230 [Halopseudomonas pachastrellae]|nr:hypothetical protein UMZ34_00230 [Halopseudomonas pachastrellae]